MEDNIKPIHYANHFITGTLPYGNKLLSIIYNVDIKRKFIPILSEEHTDYKWFKWNEFLDLGLHYEGVSLKEITK